MKRTKLLMLIFFTFAIGINSFSAIVSDNDGSAFITKAEFEAMKDNFNSQIDSYNKSIDGKIDGSIASYLHGIKINKVSTERILYKGTSEVANDRYLHCLESSFFVYVYGRPKINIFYTNTSSAQWQGLADSMGVKHSEGTLSYAGTQGTKIYAKKLGSDYIWAGYNKSLDTIDGSLCYVLAKDNDWLHGTTEGDTDKLYQMCWSSSLGNNTTTQIDNWGLTLATEAVEAYSDGNKGSAWRQPNAPTSSALTYTQEIKSYNYRNLIISGINSLDLEYPIWDEAALNTIYLPTKTSRTDTNDVYSEILEDAWDSLVLSSGVCNGSYKYLNKTTAAGKKLFKKTYVYSKAASIDFKDVTNVVPNYRVRNLPIIKYETTKRLGGLMSNDSQSLTYKKKSGSSYVDTTLTNYSLEAGMPLAVVKEEQIISWKPIFYDSSNLTTKTDPTLYLRYEPFDTSELSAYTENVVFTKKADGTIEFTATRPGVVFVKWTKGNALDLDNSSEYTLKEPE